jgi:hypothetical protein
MDRQHGVSAPAGMGLSRNKRRQSFNPTSPHAPTQHSQDIHSSANHEKSLRYPQASPQHVDATVYEPSDYLTNVIVDNMPSQIHPDYATLSATDQQYFDPGLLSATDSNYAWSPALSSALSSPCYSFNNTDASSMPSANMSRVQSTFSTTFPDSFTGDMSMMRLDSRASHMSPSASQAHYQAPIGAAASYPCPPHKFVHALDDSATHHMSFEPHTDTFDFNSAQHNLHSNERYGASLMHRDLSNTSSSPSASLTRSNKRHHETLQHSQLKIAPALHQHSSSSEHRHEHNHHQQLKNEQMSRVVSGNGEDKVQIPKSAERQKRPTAPKLVCPTCSDHPEGFRGQHELERHMSRAHAKLRKVWICVESPEGDGKFLANCKACRTKKRYGAYYNAAAQ